jgi:uncharacterized membrane protein YgcG
MKWLLTFALFGVCVGAAFAQSDWASLKPEGYVADFARVLPSEEVEALNILSAQLKEQYGVELYGVTVPDLQGVPIERFAKYLYDEWGVGGENSNNAALILMSRDTREVHIYTGMGLRGALSRQWASGVSNRFEGMVSQGRYAGAMVSVMTAMVKRVHERHEPFIARVNFGDFSSRQKAPAGISHAVLTPPGMAGIPTTAILAGGVGLFLLIYTFSRAQSKRSVYELGRDFERGRTGAFGHKKARWV